MDAVRGSYRMDERPRQVRAVEENHRVVVRSTGLGQVDDEAMPLGAVQAEGLVREPQGADKRMLDDPVAGARTADLVPTPQAAEVRALHQQLADQAGQVGSVWVAAGDGAELSHAAARFLLPVGPQVPGLRVQERVPDRVPLLGWPVDQARVKEKRAEPFINIGRQLSSTLRVDAGLTYEYS